jgi:hypothetical protein
VDKHTISLMNDDADARADPQRLDAAQGQVADIDEPVAMNDDADARAGPQSLDAAQGQVDEPTAMDCDAPAVTESLTREAHNGDMCDAAVGVTAPPSSLAAAECEAALGIDELEEHGLDGASAWLRQFENKLRGLNCGGQDARLAAVRVLLRLVENIVGSPGEQKYRRIRADNPKIRTTLLGAGAGAEGLMSLLGFQVAEESGGRVFVLRDATFDTVRLRMGQELLQRELQLEKAC